MVDKIILYDDRCNLCERTIRFIQKHDHSQQFNLVPVMSPIGQEIMKLFKLNSEDTNSVVYIEKDKLYFQSEAFFIIINQIGGIFRLLLVFSLFPKNFTNFVYNVIALNRYNWFGKNNTCRI